MSFSDSEWRMTLARELAAHYPADVILLLGSAARNFADLWSDLDLLLYWQVLPSEATRRDIAEAFQALQPVFVDSSDSPDEAALISLSDTFFIGTTKLKVDLTHKTLAAMEQLISDVCVQHQNHQVKLAALHGFWQAQILKGASIAEAWRTRVGQLPTVLQKQLLARYLDFPPHDILEMLVLRGDSLYARQLLCQASEQVMFALWVLNGYYPPLAMKHLSVTCNLLNHSPNDLYERLKQIANRPLTEALSLTVNLIEDCFTVFTQQGYDISQAQNRFQTRTRFANYHPITIKDKR